MAGDQSNSVNNAESVNYEQKLAVHCRTTITVGKLKK